jgi:hypothetical protein
MYIYIILFILIAILFYKQKNIEKFTDTIDSNSIIARNYPINVQALRNLSWLASQLTNNQLIIPGDLTVKGNINIKNWKISGGDSLSITNSTAPATINTGVTFNSNGTTNLLNSGSILAWYNLQIPNGFLICDGKNNTPNLIGKFILAASTNYPINSSGGTSNTFISSNMIPTHVHQISFITGGSELLMGAAATTLNRLVYDPLVNGGGCDGNWAYGYSNSVGSSPQKINIINSSGRVTTNKLLDINNNIITNQVPINNLPPCFTLIYIMKT